MENDVFIRNNQASLVIFGVEILNEYSEGDVLMLCDKNRARVMFVRHDGELGFDELRELSSKESISYTFKVLVDCIKKMNRIIVKISNEEYCNERISCYCDGCLGDRDRVALSYWHICEGKFDLIDRYE